MNAALEVNALRVQRGDVAAVRGVSLRVEPGAWFGLIGANGSGKTSLLRALAGRLPAQQGEIRVGGVALHGDRQALARAIGFAPDPAMLPEPLRVREVLALAGDDVDSALAGAGPVAAALEIERLVDLPVGRCSAGMRQRVAIACAFARGNRLVVLDEPFNWLDPLSAYDLREALRDMARAGTTLVTALHDLATLAAACDGGALLADGRVALALDGPAIAAARSDPLGFERVTIEHLRAGRGSGGEGVGVDRV